MIYLDAAATVPTSEGVRERIDLVLASAWGNVSGAHQVSRAAKNLLEQARESCADICMVKPDQILFTSGATEAINLVLQGYFRVHPNARLFYSAIEHPAVAETAGFLGKNGIDTRGIPVDENGTVNLNFVEDVSENDLVVVMPVNNEIGTINDPSTFVDRVHAQGAKILLDCVQSFYSFAPHVLCGQSDFAVYSGHKLGGPQGVAMLVIKDRKSISPLSFGGSQEWELRPGTTPAYLCDAFAYVFARMISRRGEIVDHLVKCKELAEKAILDALPGVTIHGSATERSPHIVSFTCENVEAQMLVAMVDAAGVCVSRGSACASGAATPSPVLMALGIDADKTTSTIRLSFHERTSLEDILTAVEVIADCVRQLETMKAGA